MSNEAQEILARALELPVTERARLAADLLDSLDDEEYEDSPEEVQQAWAEEIERRAITTGNCATRSRCSRKSGATFSAAE
jgi:putative addiction module component (TIGR02574 family)